MESEKIVLNQMYDGNIEGNMNGININLSTVLANEIVSQYMATLTEEDLQLVFDFINTKLFNPATSYSEKTIKVDEKTTDSYGWTKNNEKTLANVIALKFQEKFVDSIMEKADKIIDSEEYKERAENIAKELVDYATEGYKKDLQQKIYNRLVGDVLNTSYSDPCINGNSLKGIIQEEINKTLHYAR